MKIYKYPLHQDGGDAKISIPKGATILSVDIQADTPIVWALVNPDAPTHTRSFVVCGTGWVVPDNCKYIGTCFAKRAVPSFPNGFVWHVFERQE